MACIQRENQKQQYWRYACGGLIGVVGNHTGEWDNEMCIINAAVDSINGQGTHVIID